MKELERELRECEKDIKLKEGENKSLDEQVNSLNVLRSERHAINQINGLPAYTPTVSMHACSIVIYTWVYAGVRCAADRRNELDVRARKYEEIVQRRRLIELAKQQAQEIAVLRAEVERLRMRTFPALVQLE